MKNQKPIRVRFRNLNKHKGKDKKTIAGLSWGHWQDGKWTPSRKIDINLKEKGLSLLDTIIHEVFHCENPDMSEAQVKRQSKSLSSLLWDMGYRRVEK